jgi:hypothetical protein
MVVLQNTKAQAKHHGAVSADQRCESSLVSLRDEKVQEFRVRKVPGIFRRGHFADVAESRVHLVARHRGVSEWVVVLCLIVSSRTQNGKLFSRFATRSMVG